MPRGFRLKSRGTGDLKTRYRPQRLSETAPTCTISRIKKIAKDPGASRTYLFEGITGTGKTTCARIIARAAVCLADGDGEKPCLDCEACTNLERSPDFTEINVANFRKIDDVREIIKGMRFEPMFLKYKIYIFDEVHQLTPDSQQLLLKVLEDTPPMVLVFLCTTEKEGLKRTLLDRALPITFKRLTKPHAVKIVEQVLEDEERATDVDQNTKEDMFRRADGSVRALLNLLQAYLDGDYEVGEIEEGEVSADVKELAKALMAKEWPKAKEILKAPQVRKNPESIRISVTCYLRAVVLNKNTPATMLNIAGPLGHLSGSLAGQPAIEQYNQLVLRCLRSCYQKK